ncbi:EAL domain-containing protein [Rhodobacteraceae bacterium]|nr:EAL domain-containing protein [Paracoccaceae bacterium]
MRWDRVEGGTPAFRSAQAPVWHPFFQLPYDRRIFICISYSSMVTSHRGVRKPCCREPACDGPEAQPMKLSKLPAALKATAPHQGEDLVDIALRTVRQHLGMEVAYLSELVGDQAVFRAVNAPGWEDKIRPGQTVNIREIYCQHILDGDLPQLMADTSHYPLATKIAITHTLPIGSHVSVPLHRPDGSVFGMFCCLSRAPNPSLNKRDLRVMETFAQIAGNELSATLQRRAARSEIEDRIEDVFVRDDVAIALQPILNIQNGTLVGFEALSRFGGLPYRAPNFWFEDALSVSRQIELEGFVIRKALDLLPHLPHDLSISVNASPDTVSHGVLEALAKAAGPRRIILEMTEHAVIEDFDLVSKAITALRTLGIRVAIDDVGAGYSGLTQLLRLKPDLIKLDIELVRGLDGSSAKRSLIKGMVHFANEIGATIVAEGIETGAELEALKALGVQKGQGYLLGKPKEIQGTLAWLSHASTPPHG